jgi:hypothetical protein
MTIKRMPKQPDHQSLSVEDEVAHAICQMVYKQCDCGERARGQVCDTMKAAAGVAKTHYLLDFLRSRAHGQG